MSESAREDTEEQAEFRQYCRDWSGKNKPGEPPVRLPLSPLEIMIPYFSGAFFRAFWRGVNSPSPSLPGEDDPFSSLEVLSLGSRAGFSLC
jgi:hypothetical protein